MDISAPLTEEMLIYVGQIVCVLSALYMAKVGEFKIASVFLAAFILQIQSGYVVTLINTDVEAQGSCWAIVGSYYKCLPIAHRVSIHAAQLGTVLLGAGVFLSARKLGRVHA